MNRLARTFTLSACTLAAALLISACGGGTAGDTVAPTATISAAASTVAGNVTFTFKFSESVGTSFSVEDLVVANGTPGGLTKVDATTYTVDVTPTGATAPTVTLPAGKVFDLANNPNAVAVIKTYDPNAIVGTGDTGNCATTSSVSCFGFEDSTVIFEPFGGLASTGTVTDPAGGTNKVLQVVKLPLVGGVGSEDWAGVTLHTSAGHTAPFTSPAVAFASSKLITLRVLSPAAGKPITLKVENSSNPGANMLKTVNSTKAHEWETLTFDFATPTQSSGVNNAFVASTVFDVISVFPNFMVPETADASYYFDELTYATGASGGGAAAAPTTAPTTTIPSGSVTIYSDAATVTGLDSCPNWGQATVCGGEQTIAGNKVLKYSALTYEGIDWAANAKDVSAKGKLHIDFWTPDLTSVKVSIISAGKENAYTQTLTTGGWNGVDIDLSNYTVPDLKAIIQMKLESTTPGTLFVDNIYFWGTAAAAGGGAAATAPTTAPTTTIPSGSVTIYSDAATVTGFDSCPNWGQATVCGGEQTIAGNKVLKYSALTYEGLDWAASAQDVSAKGKLHIDFWTPDLTSVKVSIISAGKENAYTQTLTTGSWNGVDIDLSNYTVPDLKAIIQIKLEATTPGTIFVDNIYFWGTGTSSGGTTPNPTAAMGSAGPVTIPVAAAADSFGFILASDAIFAGDYIGPIDSLGNHALFAGATVTGAASNGNIGFYNDPAMSTSTQKLEEGGWVSGSSDQPGVPNFFRYFVFTGTGTAFANSYMGLFANAPNNGTVNVSTYGSIKFKLWGPASMYEQSNFNPVVEMILAGPKVAGCTTTGSGGTEIAKTFTANLKIGAGSAYKLSLANWTVKGVCGSDTTQTASASVLSALARVVVNVPGSSFNFTNANPGTPVSYSTGVNLGPIGFTNN